VVTSLRELLADWSGPVEILERTVTTAQEAAEWRFLGSPTLRLNGLDIEPAARHRADYGLG